MKAIVRKELRQGRPLLIVALVMVALLAGARLASVISLGDPRVTWRTGNTPFDPLLMSTMLALPLFFALFAGVGLFASEAEHGVLPVLFMLPLSRRRIWAAKFLAGALLTALASAIVLLSAKYLVPPLFPFAGLTPWLDLALCALFVLAVGMFVTVLTPHVIGAAVAAVALVVGLMIATFIFQRDYGAPLLGYDEFLEKELWLALTVPALLFVSLRAVVKGEMLEWGRTVLLHLPLLLLGLVVMVGIVSILGRSLTHYDRASAGQVVAPAVPSGASAVPLLGCSRPVECWRDRIDEPRGSGEAAYKIGWAPRRPQFLARGSDPMLAGEVYYRNHSTVVVDLRTGKDLAAVRDSLLTVAPMAAVSPDGRYAAIATAPVGLTWGGLETQVAARRLEVVDLRDGRRLYSGTPAALRAKGAGGDGFCTLSWSPSGQYLAFGLGWGGGTSGSLYVMRRDGTGARGLLSAEPAQSYAWAPREEALYVLASGAVTRVTPQGRRVAVWPADAAEGRAAELAASALSPDGRWLALSVSSTGPAPASREEALQPDGAPPSLSSAPLGAARLAVVRDTGQERHVIWERAGAGRFSFAWRPDGLYVLATRQERSGKDTVTAASLLRWRPGEARATELAQLPYPGGRLVPAGLDGLLVTPEVMDPQAPPRPFGVGPRPSVGVAALRPDGRLCALPGALSSPAFAAHHAYVTLDAQNRLVTVESGSGKQRLVATDLRTGAETRLYP